MAIVEYEVFAPAEILTETEQRARTLEAAALEIDVRGHAKSALMTDDGSVCLIGAVHCAEGSPDGTFGRVVNPTPGLPLLKNWGEAVNWNNAPERTAGEVTFLLRWRAEEIRDGWDA